MPKKRKSVVEDTLVRLGDWLGAAHEVLNHMGATRGVHAAYYELDDSPWPIEATELLVRETPFVIKYINDRHALDVRAPLERIAQAARKWKTKRKRVLAFGQTRRRDATDAARKLAQHTEEGIPEQRRLNLDLCIAEGAIRLAMFPLVAERSGPVHAFRVRSHLVRWALWVQKAFANVIRDGALPDEDVKPAKGEKHGCLVESPERWELANVVRPRIIPDTNDTPTKLAIEEARRVGDLVIALPLIKRLDRELAMYVSEAVSWPQGNIQPSRAEHLLRAVHELEELVGGGDGLPNNAATFTEAQDNPSEPNARGYVDDPADVTAYVPVAAIIADHCAEIGIKSPREVVRVVEDYETYHIRWTRPRSRHTNRPLLQRRSVHLADWLTFAARRSTNRDRVSNEKGFPDIHPDEIEARTRAVRRSAKHKQ